MNRTQAFSQLVSNRNWWVGIFNSSHYAAAYKSLFKKGRLSAEKQKQILIKSGAAIIKEEMWVLSSRDLNT